MPAFSLHRGNARAVFVFLLICVLFYLWPCVFSLHRGQCKTDVCMFLKCAILMLADIFVFQACVFVAQGQVEMDFVVHVADKAEHLNDIQ